MAGRSCEWANTTHIQIHGLDPDLDASSPDLDPITSNPCPDLDASNPDSGPKCIIKSTFWLHTVQCEGWKEINLLGVS